MTCPHCTKGTWVDSNGAHRRCYACRGTGTIAVPAPTAASSPKRPSGSVVIELEPDAACEQREAELVEADALLGGGGDELAVQGAGESEDELSAGFHNANGTTGGIDMDSTASDTGVMTYSDDSPQVKAAKASGQARRARAEQRKAAEARRQRYVEEHQRGEHAEDVWVGCPLCKGPQDAA